MKTYTVSNENWKLSLVQLVLGSPALMQQVEGVIYCVIFWDVYTTEKNISPFLLEKSVKNRRKRNVLNMISQFYTYIIEQLYIGVLVLIVSWVTQSWQRWAWFNIFVQAEFAIRCTVQAVGNSETRQEFTCILKKIKQIIGFGRQAV